MLPELVRIIIFDWFGFGPTQFCPYNLQWHLFQVPERPKNKIIFPRRWQIHVTRPKLEERVISHTIIPKRCAGYAFSGERLCYDANTQYTIKLLESHSAKEQIILYQFSYHDLLRNGSMTQASISPRIEIDYFSMCCLFLCQSSIKRFNILSNAAKST